MARFDYAYRQLTPNHMLLNTRGPGEATFQVYWLSDPAYKFAEVKLRLDNAAYLEHSMKFEDWRPDMDADKVETYLADHGFTADDWEVVPVPQ